MKKGVCHKLHDRMKLSLTAGLLDDPGEMAECWVFKEKEKKNGDVVLLGQSHSHRIRVRIGPQFQSHCQIQ